MIRVATHADIPKVKSLMKSVPYFWNDDWREDVLKSGIDSAHGLSYVWEEQEEVLGFICAHDVGFRAYLSELVVAGDARGQGIGMKLLKRVEDELLARGCSVMISDVWKDAEQFYRKQGWSSPDVVLLRKRLRKQDERTPL